MFSKIIASQITDVVPINFTEAILALSTTAGARNLGMMFKNTIINMFSNDAEIVISNNFIGIVTKFSDKFLESTLDRSGFKVLEAKVKFVAGGMINEEESIIYASKRAAITIYYIIMKDFAICVGLVNCICIASLLRKSCSSTSRNDGISTRITDNDSVLCLLLHILKDWLNVLEANALL